MKNVMIDNIAPKIPKKILKPIFKVFTLKANRNKPISIAIAITKKNKNAKIVKMLNMLKNLLW